MVAINSGPVLHTGDVPSSLMNYASLRRGEGLTMAAAAAPGGKSFAADNGVEKPMLSPVLPLVEMEKRAIRQALHYTKGDRVTAAQLLGIGRTTLYRKLKEYGIEE
jgi:DNA-binding NtrC family response regulator